MHKTWFQFAARRSFNPYQPNVANVLAFLHDRHKLNASPKTLLNYKTALKWVVNSSFHFVLDSVLISRYITGVFN